MHSDLFTAIAGFISLAWRFFMEVEFPGTGLTFAQIGIGLLLIGVAFNVLSSILGTHISSGQIVEVRDKLDRKGKRK